MVFPRQDDFGGKDKRHAIANFLMYFHWSHHSVGHVRVSGGSGVALVSNLRVFIKSCALKEPNRGC